MKLTQNKRVIGLCMLAVGFFGAQGSAAAEWRFPAVDRVVAVADIHGAYGAFEKILKQADVIDEFLAWSGGATHLVIVGDVLDRGAESRRAMDLIMRLQSEALSMGGNVHLVLGNHELMNLAGDLRYVAPGEFAAFAPEENLEAREAAFRRALERIEEPLEEASARAGFDRRFPPGFFAHRAAFASDGVYGAWLLDQPLLVLIGDTAFVHGGLSEAVIELGGEGVNTELLQQVVDYVRLLEDFTESGLLAPGDSFYDHASIVDAFAERVALGEATWPAGLEAAAERLEDLNRALVFDLQSPTWYRGTVDCSPLIERDRLTRALAVLGVQRVVVGHTPTPDARVLSRLDQTVLRADTGMLNEYYGGRAAAVVIEGSDVTVLYEDMPDAIAPTRQPRRVGVRPAGLSAEDLEAFLLNGQIVSSELAEGGYARITLEQEGVELDAFFTPASRASIRPDVAAYRLDRLIGLDMVPVTVAREFEGEPGSLQFEPDRVITEPERSAQGVGGSAWCPLRDQFQSMYVFDSLIFNEGRTPDRIRYSSESYQLILVGHENSLSTRRGRPPHLAELQLSIGAAWEQALADLTEESLGEALGDVLDRRRIRALLQRRDELLEAAVPPGS